MDLIKILAIVGVILILLVILMIIIIINKAKKIKKDEIIYNDFQIKLYQALGQKENIKNIEKEHQRIKLNLHDASKVDTNLLAELQVPAFLKDKELKLLIKQNDEKIFDFLSDKISN